MAKRTPNIWRDVQAILQSGDETQIRELTCPRCHSQLLIAGFPTPEQTNLSPDATGMQKVLHAYYCVLVTCRSCHEGSAALVKRQPETPLT